MHENHCYCSKAASTHNISTNGYVIYKAVSAIYLYMHTHIHIYYPEQKGDSELQNYYPMEWLCSVINQDKSYKTPRPFNGLAT